MTRRSAPEAALTSYRDATMRWRQVLQGQPAARQSHLTLPDHQSGVLDHNLTVAVSTELASLEDEWRDLEDRTTEANIFQSFTWCATWVEASRHAGQPIRLRIITIRSDDGLCFLWPLSIRRVFGIEVLHSIGEPATQYAGALVADGVDEDALVRLAWQAVRSWRDVDLVELLRVRDDSTLRFLWELVGTEGWRRLAAAPAYAAAGAATSVPSRLRSSRTRNALRRHWRQLENTGPATFELTECKLAGQQALVDVLRFKSDWLRQKGLASGGYSHPVNSDFLRRLIETGFFQISILRVGERTVAVELGARKRDIYWSLIQSYQIDLASNGPGRLLSWRLLDVCVEHGVKMFDFLAPAQPHKVEWANTEMAVRSMLLPLTFRGILIGAYLANLKPRLKRLHEAMPTRLRRAAAPLVNILR